LENLVYRGIYEFQKECVHENSDQGLPTLCCQPYANNGLIWIRFICTYLHSLRPSGPQRELGYILLFFYWRYNPLWFCILQPSSRAIASSRTRFLDHTQRRATVERAPLDEYILLLIVSV